MPSPTLTPTQRDLVNAMTNAGPARWRLDVKPASSPYIRAVLATFLQENSTYLETTGLVISPAAVMHNWWAAGWQGAHITPVSFFKLPAYPVKHFGVVVIDEQGMYSERFLRHLDELLTTQAERAVFWLPPEPPPELKAVLLKHLFIPLRIN